MSLAKDRMIQDRLLCNAMQFTTRLYNSVAHHVMHWGILPCHATPCHVASCNRNPHHMMYDTMQYNANSGSLARNYWSVMPCRRNIKPCNVMQRPRETKLELSHCRCTLLCSNRNPCSTQRLASQHITKLNIIHVECEFHMVGHSTCNKCQPSSASYS